MVEFQLGECLKILLKYSAIRYSLIGVVILFFSTIIFICIRQLKNGSNLRLLWGLIIINPNTAVQNLEEKIERLNTQFNDLNTEDKVKTHVIKTLSTAIQGRPIKGESTSEGSNEELKRMIKRYYILIFPMLLGVLAKRNSENNHRIALYTRLGETLFLHQGCGLSEKSRKVLAFGSTGAGYSYTKGEIYYSGDINKDPQFKPNPETGCYESLLCIPIKYNSKIIGVFNIDGELKDSFNKDDINYITYTVDAIAPVLDLELQLEKESTREAMLNEQVSSN